MKATVSVFAQDITPPKGHPLCGGWITPAKEVMDPLEARGFVFQGTEAPWVFCALDWVALRNQAFFHFQKALAEAAETSPERVWIHCVHPHDAPFADVGAQGYLDMVHGPASLDLAFFEKTVMKTADALKRSKKSAQVVDQIAMGKARVNEVASARRILGPDGKVQKTRTSFTKDPAAREAPEGLIDPWLRTVSFLRGDRPIVTTHTYATHPMSRYGEGKVSADFPGQARRQWEKKQGCFTIYSTGCAGNVTAGKYNDGSPEGKQRLVTNLEKAMDEAWDSKRVSPLSNPIFRHHPILFSPRKEKNFGADQSRKVLEDPKATPAGRGNAAFQLAWLDRIKQPVHAASVDFGSLVWFSLPGEPFIEYQIFAQEISGSRFAVVTGYGDDGPGYIPTDSAFSQGGYEPTVALAAPSESLIKQTLAKLAGR